MLGEQCLGQAWCCLTHNRKISVILILFQSIILQFINCTLVLDWYSLLSVSQSPGNIIRTEKIGSVHAYFCAQIYIVSSMSED